MEGTSRVPPPPVFSPPPEDPAGVPRTSRSAVAALVLGLCSLVFSLLTALPAVLLGIVALVRIRQSGGRLAGTPHAVTGIVSAVLLGLLTVSFWLPPRPASERRRMESCLRNLRMLSVQVRVHADSHDGLCPAAAEVWRGVDPGMLKCKSREDLPNGYVYNAKVAGMPFGPMEAVVAGKGKMQLGEETIWLFADGGERTPGPGQLPNIGYSRADFSFERHRNKKLYQVSFMDGHVETLKKNEYPLDFELVGEANAPR